MKFRAWADDQIKAKNAKTLQALFRALESQIAGASLSFDRVTVATLRNVYHGMRLRHIGKAGAISVATDSAVSVEDLCNE